MPARDVASVFRGGAAHFPRRPVRRGLFTASESSERATDLPHDALLRHRFRARRRPSAHSARAAQVQGDGTHSSARPRRRELDLRIRVKGGGRVPDVRGALTISKAMWRTTSSWTNSPRRSQGCAPDVVCSSSRIPPRAEVRRSRRHRASRSRTVDWCRRYTVSIVKCASRGCTRRCHRRSETRRSSRPSPRRSSYTMFFGDCRDRVSRLRPSSLRRYIALPRAVHHNSKSTRVCSV